MIHRTKQQNYSRFKPAIFVMMILLCGLFSTAEAITEGFEGTTYGLLNWITDTPNDQWNLSSYEPYAGTYCMISGGFFNNSVSNLNLNLNITTAGTVSFAMRTDTEYGGGEFGDFLRFYIDGVLQARWAGINPWSVQSFAISAGVHNLSWSFKRDAFDMDEGVHEMDRVFIDNITLPPCFTYQGEGFGSAADPYRISTASQLNSIRNYLGSSYANVNFKLVSDISLSSYLQSGGEGYTAWGTSGWLPFGSASAPFYGHFDGNYKTISGLKISRASLADCGLWSTTATGSLIENLNVSTETSAVVQGSSATGMLVGRHNGTLTNCSATGSVRGGVWLGGMVGWNNGDVRRCHTAGDVLGGGNTVGGLVGQNNGFIYESYSRASARGVDYVGGLVGYQGTGSNAGITNCFATGSVTNTGNQGFRGGILGFLNSGTASNSYWDLQTTGMNTSYALPSSYAKTTAAMQTQATFVGWDFAGETANGTNDYWFLNSTVNNGYPYLVWEQVASGNPVLPRISVSATQFAFGDVYPGTSNSQSFVVTNIGQLSLSGTMAIPTDYTVNGQASSLGFTLSPGASLNCALTFAPSGYGNFSGNLVITSNSDRESTYTMPVSGICIPIPEEFAGGSGTEADPWLISTPGQLRKLNEYLGAEHSDKYYKILNDIDMTTYLTQGNAGYNYGYGWDPIGTRNDPFFGKVDGNYRSITGVKALHANHSGYESWIGFFGNTGAGFSLRNLTLGCSWITGYNQIGGLVGANSGTISNCHVTVSSGVFSLFGVYCGGLVGINFGAISKSSFHGMVQGTYYVGGFVGTGQGSFTDCYVNGAVLGYDQVGGFSGTAGGHFSNCYAAVTMDYSANEAPSAGGFAGYIVGTSISFANCYWDKVLSNTATSAGMNASYGKTTAEMKTASTYVGFDMVNVWQLSAEQNSGYPFIRPAPPTAITNFGSLSRSILIGSQTTELFRLSNSGGSDLAYTITVEYPSRGSEDASAELGREKAKFASPQRTTVSWLTLDEAETHTGTLISGSQRDFSLGLSASQLPTGNYSANIRIVSNAPGNSPMLIPVSLVVEYGANPFIFVSADSLDFGGQLVNSSSTRELGISNVGNTTLTGSFTAPLGYSISEGRNLRNSVELSIAAGASQTFILTFNPTVPGNYDAVMHIQTNSLLSADLPVYIYAEGYIPPILEVSAPAVHVSLAPEELRTVELSLGNSGSRPLEYSMQLLNAESRDKLPIDQDRNITGSTLVANTSLYQANTTVDWVFSVYNASPDYEWLRSVRISFPAGVVVNSATGFVGGTGGAMVPDQVSGNGIAILWTGNDGGWGVVRGGETAVTTVNVTILGDLAGSLNMDYQIDGDVYGGQPHSLNGTIVMEPASVSLGWVSISPVSGSVSGGATRQTTLSFDAGSLSPGSYHATLRINSNDLSQPILDIPVQMNIVPQGMSELIISRDGSAIMLSWAELSGASLYRVYRAVDPQGEFILIGETDSAVYVDIEPLPQAFYQVTAVF